MASIDQAAWTFVLNNVWGVELGKKGSEELEQAIPARPQPGRVSARLEPI
jgi:hypothetical protein